MRRRRAALWAVLASVAVGIAAVVRGRTGLIAAVAGELHPYLHLFIFASIAFLTSWSTRSANLRALLCAGVALLGLLTETTEWYFDHMAMEWTDVILDAIGAVAGSGLGALYEAAITARRS